MTRRTLFASIAGGAAAAVSVQAGPGSGLRLGIDTWSLHRQKWNAIQMLDWAAGQKLDMIQASHGDFVSFEPAYLKQVKDHADRLGIWIEPGFGCICPLSKGWNKRQGDAVAYLRFAIGATRALGSPSCKVFLGNAADRAAGPVDELMEATIRALKEVRTQALDAGVKLAVENHGDMQSREVRTLIEEAGKDFVASCFDSGNPPVLGEDPLAALEVLAPYIVTSHIRDCAVFEHPRGAAVQWVALGEGTIDMELFTKRFAELCPKAPFQLEILTGDAPRVVPYLEPDYWKRFPRMPAADLSRFIRLAKSGHPFYGTMLIADRGKLPPEYEAALRAQERFDLERSLDFARQKLGAGVRNRS